MFYSRKVYEVVLENPVYTGKRRSKERDVFAIERITIRVKGAYSAESAIDMARKTLDETWSYSVLSVSPVAR